MNIYYDKETLDIVNYADAENNCFYDRTSRPETADVFITIPLEDNSRNISLVRNGDTIDIIKHVVESTLWMYYDKDKTKIISLYDTGIIDHSNAYPHDTVENVGHIQLPLNSKIDFIDIQVDEHGNVTTFTNKNREKYHWLVSDWETIRDKRYKYLLSCDWTHTTDVELTDEKKHEWTVYRKSLRDITTSFDKPSDVVWPTPPQ
jgi:hypothetical protein